MWHIHDTKRDDICSKQRVEHSIRNASRLRGNDRSDVSTYDFVTRLMSIFAANTNDTWNRIWLITHKFWKFDKFAFKLATVYATIVQLIVHLLFNERKKKKIDYF